MSEIWQTPPTDDAPGVTWRAAYADTDMQRIELERENARLTAALATAEAELEAGRCARDEAGILGMDLPQTIRALNEDSRLGDEEIHRLRAQLAARQAALERIGWTETYPKKIGGDLIRHHIDRAHDATDKQRGACFICAALTDAADPLPPLRALWAAADKLADDSNHHADECLNDDDEVVECNCDLSDLRAARAALPWLAPTGGGK